MLRPTAKISGSRFEEVPIPQGGYELHHVTRPKQAEIRKLIGVLLSGDDSPTFDASIVHYDLSTGDHVTAGCHFAHGYSRDNQDRIAINVEGSSVSGIDGYDTGGGVVADLFGRELLFDDPLAAAKETSTQIRQRPIFGAATFAHAHIASEPDGKKYLKPTHSGDVHILVLDENGAFVWESEDEHRATFLKRIGHISPDEATYHDHRRLVMNKVSSGDPECLQLPPVELKPGYRVVLYSDGLGDNVLTEEMCPVPEDRLIDSADAGRPLAVDIRGVDSETAIKALGAKALECMSERDDIVARTPDRAAQGRYAHGLKSRPKKDNLLIAIIDVV